MIAVPVLLLENIRLFYKKEETNKSTIWVKYWWTQLATSKKFAIRVRTEQDPERDFTSPIPKSRILSNERDYGINPEGSYPVRNFERIPLRDPESNSKKNRGPKTRKFRIPFLSPHSKKSEK